MTSLRVKFCLLLWIVSVASMSSAQDNGLSAVQKGQSTATDENLRQLRNLQGIDARPEGEALGRIRKLTRSKVSIKLYRNGREANLQVGDLLLVTKKGEPSEPIAHLVVSKVSRKSITASIKVVLGMQSRKAMKGAKVYFPKADPEVQGTASHSEPLHPTIRLGLKNSVSRFHSAKGLSGISVDPDVTGLGPVVQLWAPALQGLPWLNMFGFEMVQQEFAENSVNLALAGSDTTEKQKLSGSTQQLSFSILPTFDFGFYTELGIAYSFTDQRQEIMTGSTESKVIADGATLNLISKVWVLPQAWVGLAFRPESEKTVKVTVDGTEAEGKGTWKEQSYALSAGLVGRWQPSVSHQIGVGIQIENQWNTVTQSFDGAETVKEQSQTPAVLLHMDWTYLDQNTSL